MAASASYGELQNIECAVTITAPAWIFFDHDGLAVYAMADTADNQAVALVMVDGDDETPTQAYYAGVIEKTGWGLTPNANYYLSDSIPGAMSESPTGKIQFLGRAISADRFLVNILPAAL